MLMLSGRLLRVARSVPSDITVAKDIPGAKKLRKARKLAIDRINKMKKDTTNG